MHTTDVRTCFLRLRPSTLLTQKLLSVILLLVLRERIADSPGKDIRGLQNATTAPQAGSGLAACITGTPTACQASSDGDRTFVA